MTNSTNQTLPALPQVTPGCTGGLSKLEEATLRMAVALIREGAVQHSQIVKIAKDMAEEIIE